MIRMILRWVSLQVVLGYSSLFLPPPPTLSHTFYWMVADIKGVDDCLVHVQCDKVFARMNWCNRYLWGKKHNNRFKQMTKIYMVRRPSTGKHGVVVGHTLDFDILVQNKSIILKVVFADNWHKPVEVK